MPAATRPASMLDLCPRPRGHDSRDVLGQTLAGQRPVLDENPIDVSVCIANWNCRRLLRDCLESLHPQAQGVRLETIVVDNASSDGAADLVAEEFPQVVLERNGVNVGFARANNQAARRARGRYLFFLNNDTIVPAGAVRRLLDYAKAHPNIGIIGPRLRDGQGRIQDSCRRLPTLTTFLNRLTLVRWTGLLRGSYRRYRRLDGDPNRIRPAEMLMGAAILMRRDLFFNCGGWDEDFAFGGEDLDLCVRVGRRHPLVYYPEVEIIHFGRASTRQRGGPASSQIASGFVRFLRKSGSSRPAVAFYKLLVTVDAPVELLVRTGQYGFRLLRGHPADARKSLLRMRTLGHFLCRGLIPFWKS